jgi:ATP-binding cassette subfamily C (CFTR/MRP) protein 4
MLSNKCVILVTHQIQYLNQCDVVLGLKEGRMEFFGNPSDIFSDERNVLELLNSSIVSDNSRNAFVINMNNTDKLLENDEKSLTEPKPNNDQNGITSSSYATEQRSHGTISMKTYYQYFISGGGYIFTLLVVLIFILTEANMVAADWWISDWANCHSEPNLNRSTCFLHDNKRIAIYSGMVGSLAVFGVLRVVLFVLLMLNSSKVLHNKMFSNVLKAPVLFFDTNTTGGILNRFSKDIGFLDDRLIQAFFGYLIVS